MIFKHYGTHVIIDLRFSQSVINAKEVKVLTLFLGQKELRNEVQFLAVLPGSLMATQNRISGPPMSQVARC